jgi:ribosomal protein S18 acetylase RimI-like enzyme
MSLRPPRDEDAVVVAQLMSEFAPDRMDPETVIRDWTAPYIEREHDVRVEPGSYALVEDMTEGRVWIELHGRPSDDLVEWAEVRGAEKGRRFFSGAWSTDETILDLLAQRGYGITRHAHRMETALDRDIPSPVWPDGVVVRSYEDGDERTFYEIHQETFEDTWEPIRDTYGEWVHQFLDDPDFVPDLWFLALAGNEPAGFAVCQPYSTRKELGWIRILGVRRPWRRRGVARALLLHAFGEFASRGMTHAGLGVDSTSLTGANKLYESAGMHVTARFDIVEKAVA